MTEASFPYCIPDKRELTAEELDLLKHLVNQVDDIDIDLGELKVVARCGCGTCPTILFGKSLDDDPITSSDSDVVMEWMGRPEPDKLIGILLFAKDGIPTELAAFSMSANDADAWPPLATIQPI
jgi:hypothetical protein